MNHIYLIGFMGAGKSTVGRLLAEELQRPFVDLDQRAEEVAGRSIAEVFESQGEEGFRALESGVLADVMRESPSVVACGGGVVIRDENRVVLTGSGRVVYLKVSAGEALARIADRTTRPLLAGGAGAMTATSLLAARERLYSAIADLVVDTEGLTPSEVADRLAHWYEGGSS